eukprot:scaffold5125_cov134-Isochrysis_galbana.AAC.8
MGEGRGSDRTAKGQSVFRRVPAVSPLTSARSANEPLNRRHSSRNRAVLVGALPLGREVQVRWRPPQRLLGLDLLDEPVWERGWFRLAQLEQLGQVAVASLLQAVGVLDLLAPHAGALHPALAHVLQPTLQP